MPATAPDSSSTTEAPTEGDTLLTPAVPAAEGEAPKTDDAPNPLFGVPEGDYEISGLPEGTVIDAEALSEFAPIAKELGLSNEGMSKVATAYAQILPKVTERVVEGIQQDVVAQHAAWAAEAVEQVKTDPAFNGQQLSAVQQVSAKALDRFGGAEFRSFLQDTGLGNHPAMLKFAYLAGTAISEDTTFERGGTTPAAKTTVEKFYGPAS